MLLVCPHLLFASNFFLISYVTWIKLEIFETWREDVQDTFLMKIDLSSTEFCPIKQRHTSVCRYYIPCCKLDETWHLKTTFISVNVQETLLMQIDSSSPYTILHVCAENYIVPRQFLYELNETYANYMQYRCAYLLAD